MDHQFEDIAVKVNAPELLEDELRRKRHRCMIGTGGMSDPYLPFEKDLCLTRKCLELIDRYGYGLAIQTKSDLILRDLDLLKSINRKTKCVVQMTLTTYDEELCRIIEPNVCTTKRRLEVLKIMRDEGIPTVVWMTPILPFINDTEENIRGLLDYCIEAKVYGIICFGIGVTLREGDREYFYKQLDISFPGMKEKYIRTYGNAYEIPSLNQDSLMKITLEKCIDNGIVSNGEEIFAWMGRFEDKISGKQMTLTDYFTL
jgi:DNA repair photolyase